MGLLDRTRFTTAGELIELMVADKFDKLPAPERGDVREFTAIALTDAIPLSKTKFYQYVATGTTKSSGTGTARFILKAMITGDTDGNPLPLTHNPHRYLLNPCSLDKTRRKDVNFALRTILTYTTYISSKDFVITDTKELTIRKNDQIKVSMTVDDNDDIIMENGEIIELVSRAANNPLLTNTCENLSGLFKKKVSRSLLGPRTGAGSGTAVVDTRISTSTWLPCIEDVRPLLDFIASGEGEYNSMNQGTDASGIVGSTDDSREHLGSKLTDMTISQVRAAQAKPWGSSRRLFAAGRYQITPGTMPAAIRNSGLRGNFVFNKENQDILGVALIFGVRPTLGNYLLGLHDNQHEAHLEFAKEWASVPDPRKDPPESYHGHGNKSAHTNEQVAAALDAARAAVSTKCGTPPVVAAAGGSSG